jgi:uncharacterized membrane protein YdjX (TVP38/TMEM64 family)
MTQLMQPSYSPESFLPPERDNGLASLAVYLGARPDMPDRRAYLFFLAVSVLVSLGMLAYVGYIFLEPVRRHLYQAVLEPERLRAAVDYFGYWGPLFFIVMQAMQVILMIWPVPFELAGGFLFGLPWGLLYSILGLALGSMLAFLLGRWLEKRFLSRRVNPDTMRLFRRLMKREGTLVALLVFVLPGFPKDVFCYLFGLTRISLVFFLAATTLVRLPSTILFTFQGAQIYQGHYGITLVLLAVYLGLAFLLYRQRSAVYQWLSRWHLEEE